MIFGRGGAMELRTSDCKAEVTEGANHLLSEEGSMQVGKKETERERVKKRWKES